MKIKRRVDKKEFYNRAKSIKSHHLNKSTDVKQGDIYNTTNGDCVVIRYVSCSQIEIKFISTGYVKWVELGNLRKGTVKDPLHPMVYGVGYIGVDFKTISKTYPILYKKAYKVWNHMISRCHNISDKLYKTYGGSGVTISDDWYNFSIFFYDFIELTGFEINGVLNGTLELDKDKLQTNKSTSERVYSKTTCCMLTSLENNGYRDGVHKIKKFIVIYPVNENGETMICVDENANLFSKNHNLSCSNVTSCIRGNLGHTGGYRFLPYSENIVMNELREDIVSLSWKEIYNKYVTNLVKCND